MVAENSIYLFLWFRAKKVNAVIEVVHPFGYYSQLDFSDNDRFLGKRQLFLRLLESRLKN